ncbi:MAG: NTP transferase domain-containing protein [Desulfovibrionaceae bacterium]|nr:NTP transferase domain-containing protein [Desulfovibrionaceae bacterium]
MDPQTQRGKFAAIILAAGLAQRMGEIKALLPFSNLSALATIVWSYRFAKIEPILVVSGYHALEVEAEALNLKVQVCRNPEPSLGMFSSLKVGLSSFVKQEQFKAFFIHPVDCPLIRPLTLLKLKESYEALDNPLVLVPTFLGKSGHPPLIPHELAAKILELPLNFPQGLAGVLREAKSLEIAVPDSFILQDMDIREDYENLKAQSFYHKALTPLEALELLRLSQVSAKGIRHGEAVGKVAKALAIKVGGCSKDLAYAGGLVHDLAKGHSQHEAYGAWLLESLGLPKLARIVRDHRDLTLRDDCPLTERELVYLADKYCLGGGWVPLKERFGQKLSLYAKDQEACKAIEIRLSHALSLEARLKREIKEDPAAIAKFTLEHLYD